MLKQEAEEAQEALVSPRLGTTTAAAAVRQSEPIESPPRVAPQTLSNASPSPPQATSPPKPVSEKSSTSHKGSPGQMSNGSSEAEADMNYTSEVLQTFADKTDCRIDDPTLSTDLARLQIK